MHHLNITNLNRKNHQSLIPAWVAWMTTFASVGHSKDYAVTPHERALRTQVKAYALISAIAAIVLCCAIPSCNSTSVEHTAFWSAVPLLANWMTLAFLVFFGLMAARYISYFWLCRTWKKIAGTSLHAYLTKPASDQIMRSVHHDLRFIAQRVRHEEVGDEQFHKVRDIAALYLYCPKNLRIRDLVNSRIA